MMTLALSKGRIFDETLPLLAARGHSVAEDPETSRKLILPTNRADLRVVIVRASDVPTYVQYGAADFGVAGKDVLLEHGALGHGGPVSADRSAASRAAGMCVAVPAGFDYASCGAAGLAHCAWRPSTCNWRAQHFAAKGVHVDLIKLYGSMELAPLAGLADAIVDLVSTGSTLQGQQPGRGGADHGHPRAADRQPGGAEAQARARCDR